MIRRALKSLVPPADQGRLHAQLHPALLFVIYGDEGSPVIIFRRCGKNDPWNRVPKANFLGIAQYKAFLKFTPGNRNIEILCPTAIMSE
jgi:hypothetical protein